MPKSLDRRADAALLPLKGLGMTAFGRATDLVWIHFGPLRRVPAHKGGTKLVGKYALHIQCPWRLRRANKLVTGRGDIFVQRKSSKSTLFDSRAREVPLKGALKVREAHADPVGGFTLELDRGWALEVFPMESAKADRGEWWRLFEPGSDERHFVAESGMD